MVSCINMLCTITGRGVFRKIYRADIVHVYHDWILNGYPEEFQYSGHVEDFVATSDIAVYSASVDESVTLLCPLDLQGITAPHR